MINKLGQDWERVVDVWVRVKNTFPNSEMQLFESIYEMRKLDRGIDYPLRRLLDSEEYGQRIRVYGSTSSGFGRHPFRWDNKVWLLIRVKLSVGGQKQWRDEKMMKMCYKGDQA